MLAYFIAALSPNMDVANAALPTYVVSLLFFSGFLIRYDDIPNYWKWYSFIDFLKYAWGALMKNQFAGDRNIDVRLWAGMCRLVALPRCWQLVAGGVHAACRFPARSAVRVPQSAGSATAARLPLWPRHLAVRPTPRSLCPAQPCWTTTTWPASTAGAGSALRPASPPVRERRLLTAAGHGATIRRANRPGIFAPQGV